MGPVVQQDLMSILMRFRTQRYVLVGDIIKMYQQILLHPSQTRLQRILWHDDPSDSPKVYELVTLTYGTSPASYLATRCLRHLADQHLTDYPLGSISVRRDFYMDDLLTGADTLNQIKTIRDETIELLRLGGFVLSKWASNCPELLKDLNSLDSNVVTIDNKIDSRILGVRWNQALDTFCFFYEPPEVQSVVSKRNILSEISRLFDPLGLLGPIIVIAKLILQDLWRSGIHWDESVPQDIHSSWLKLKSQLVSINRLQISRCIKFSIDSCHIQVHGFCDASQRAFGACVYLRTDLKHGKYRSELLCSKSRVAPLKAMTLPRLELSVALLLARLIDKVRSSIDLTQVQIFLWSDSTIALNWISSPSRKWPTFVANRVGEIQRLTKLSCWRHVSSGDNPADILSRGLSPPALADSSVWWHGPVFLAAGKDHWPSSDFVRLENPESERRILAAVVRAPELSIVSGLLNKHSCLNRVCRIVAYCLRFLKSRSNPSTITHQENRLALTVICKSIQREVFPAEYKALAEGDAINKY